MWQQVRKGVFRHPTLLKHVFTLTQFHFFQKAFGRFVFTPLKKINSETSDIATELDFHPLVRSTHNFLPESFSVVIENKNIHDYMQMSFFFFLNCWHFKGRKVRGVLLLTKIHMLC